MAYTQAELNIFKARIMSPELGNLPHQQVQVELDNGTWVDILYPELESVDTSNAFEQKGRASFTIHSADGIKYDFENPTTTWYNVLNKYGRRVKVIEGYSNDGQFHYQTFIGKIAECGKEQTADAPLTISVTCLNKLDDLDKALTQTRVWDENTPPEAIIDDILGDTQESDPDLAYTMPTEQWQQPSDWTQPKEYKAEKTDFYKFMRYPDAFSIPLYTGWYENMTDGNVNVGDRYTSPFRMCHIPSKDWLFFNTSNGDTVYDTSNLYHFKPLIYDKKANKLFYIDFAQDQTSQYRTPRHYVVAHPYRGYVFTFGIMWLNRWSNGSFNWQLKNTFQNQDVCELYDFENRKHYILNNVYVGTINVGVISSTFWGSDGFVYVLSDTNVYRCKIDTAKNTATWEFCFVLGDSPVASDQGQLASNPKILVTKISMWMQGASTLALFRLKDSTTGGCRIDYYNTRDWSIYESVDVPIPTTNFYHAFYDGFVFFTEQREFTRYFIINPLDGTFEERTTTRIAEMTQDARKYPEFIYDKKNHTLFVVPYKTDRSGGSIPNIYSFEPFKDSTGSKVVGGDETVISQDVEGFPNTFNLDSNTQPPINFATPPDIPVLPQVQDQAKKDGLVVVGDNATGEIKVIYPTVKAVADYVLEESKDCFDIATSMNRDKYNCVQIVYGKGSMSGVVSWLSPYMEEGEQINIYKKVIPEFNKSQAELLAKKVLSNSLGAVVEGKVKANPKQKIGDTIEILRTEGRPNIKGILTDYNTTNSKTQGYWGTFKLLTNV